MSPEEIKKRNCRYERLLLVRTSIPCGFSACLGFFAVTPLYLLFPCGFFGILLLLATLWGFWNLLLFALLLPLIRLFMGILFRRPKKEPVPVYSVPYPSSGTIREQRDWLLEVIGAYEKHAIGTSVFLKSLESVEHSPDELQREAGLLWEWFGDEPENPRFPKELFSILLQFKIALSTDRVLESVPVFLNTGNRICHILFQIIIFLLFIVPITLSFYDVFFPRYTCFFAWPLCGRISYCVFAFYPWYWRTPQDCQEELRVERFGWFSGYSEISSLMRKYHLRKPFPERSSQIGGGWFELGDFLFCTIYGGLSCMINLLSAVFSRSSSCMRLSEKIY